MFGLLKGKGGIILSALCIIFGILFFLFFDWFKNAYEGPHAIRHSFIMSLIMDNLGRYGTSGIFFGGGAVIGLRSWMEMKNK